MRAPNCWVVVARSGELDDGLLGRQVFGRRLLLYRRADGHPVALADRCCHRGYPLSLGTRDGDQVVCGYHGYTYASDGACVAVPGQSEVPARAAVPAFATVDVGGWTWAWLGDQARAAAPTVAPRQGRTWRSVGGHAHIAAPAVLLVENLNDLSHIPFVHPGTIGSAAFAELPYTLSEEDGVLWTERRWQRVDAPPTYQRAAGLRSPVDRVLRTAFHPPSLVVIHSEIRPSGTGEAETRHVLHEIAIVPEDDESVHYLWCSSWDFALDDDAVAEEFAATQHQVIAEDKRVLEAQWLAGVNAEDGPGEVNLRSDRASLRARRIFRHVLDTGRLPAAGLHESCDAGATEEATTRSELAGAN